jgi:xylulokinase
MAHLLGLDIGTTTIKGVLYDPHRGEVIHAASLPTPLDQPWPGRFEHDPEKLWQSITGCLQKTAAGSPVSALAISSFAEAGLPLDANFQPLYPVIAWYDRRTEPQAAWWEAQMPMEAMHAVTGQRVNPSFGVNKWLWIKENEPEAASRTSLWLSVPDYLMWRLTGELVTDYTIASRTFLFNPRTLEWSSDMLAKIGMPVEHLPRPFPSGTHVGTLTRRAAAATGLPAGTACVLGGHDHLCAAFTAGGYQPGTVIDSTGTAQAVLFILEKFQTDARLASQGFACYPHVVPGHYILKGGLKSAGGAIEWLARQLAGVDPDRESLPYAQLAALAEGGIGQRAGPVWLPHLIGSGTPESDTSSRAAIVGLQVEHTAGDIFRGLLESLAFWLRHCLAEMEIATGQETRCLIALGGVTRLELLTRLKANILNLPVTIPDLPQAAATGAALLAGLGAGVFHTPAEAVESLKYSSQTIIPQPDLAGWYARLYEAVYSPLYDALRKVNHDLEAIEGEMVRYDPT